MYTACTKAVKASVHPVSCTPQGAAVHPMYMVKRKEKPLRWRKNAIRAWRELRKFTLETASEALSHPPHDIEITHNSLGRIENGKQMPSIELIEALAKLYDTDIDSLLNRPPASGAAQTATGILSLWDRAAADERGLILDVAKRVVKTGT